MTVETAVAKRALSKPKLADLWRPITRDRRYGENGASPTTIAAVLGALKAGS